MSLLLLLLLLLASGLAFYFITHEARRAKKASLEAVAKLRADSTSLVNSRDSLQEEFNKADSTLALKRDSLNNAYATGDLGKVMDLQNEILKLRTDSATLAKIKEENDKKIAKLDEVLKRRLRVSYDQLVVDPDATVQAMQVPPPPPPSQVVTDFEEYRDLVKKHDALKAKYDKLDYDFNQHLRLYHNTLPLPLPPPLPTFDTTNSWKLIVNNRGKQPGEMTLIETESILLIPDIPANRAFIKKAKLYDINCSSVNKAKITGLKKATYYNGNFYFPNVGKGNYLIKICSYYGGYHVQKKKDGMDSVRLEGVGSY